MLVLVLVLDGLLRNRSRSLDQFRQHRNDPLEIGFFEYELKLLGHWWFANHGVGVVWSFYSFAHAMDAFDSETILAVRYQFDCSGSTQSIGTDGAVLHDKSVGGCIPDTFAEPTVGIKCPGSEFALAGIPSDPLEALHEDLVAASDVDIADDEVTVVVPSVVE